MIDDPKFRAQVEEVKAKLRLGGLHWFNRGYGSSTAILELVYEYGEDKCALVLPNAALARYTINMFCHMFGSDQGRPLVIVYGSSFDDCKFRGMRRDIKVFVDCWDSLDRRYTPELRHVLGETVEFWAGVY